MEISALVCRNNVYFLSDCAEIVHANFYVAIDTLCAKGYTWLKDSSTITTEDWNV